MEDKYKKFRKYFVLGLLLIIFIIANTVSEQTNKDLSPQDSGAVYGGKLENGYEFAGFSLTQYGNNQVGICGVTFLAPRIGLTAAHCVDKNYPVKVSKGQFSNNLSNYIDVERVDIHALWNGSTNYAYDLAILHLSEDIELSQYAQISNSNSNCNYEVVGYGRDDNGGSSANRLRKSATMCIESISSFSGTLNITGKDGGVCYGDSGSSFFEKGTNKIVGIASQVVADSNDTSRFCYVNNKAIAVDIMDKIDLETFSFIYDEVAPITNAVFCGEIDVNNDGKINIVDFASFTRVYNKECRDTQSIKPLSSCGIKDANKGGKLNLVDFQNFIKNYNKNSCK